MKKLQNSIRIELYRALLGYLPQDFGYYPEFTAREFVQYIAALKGIEKKKAKKKTEELLELVGLSDIEIGGVIYNRFQVSGR